MENTNRFSNRVKDYVKYRPGYPAEMIDFFASGINDNNSIIADIGAGTGILTGLLLQKGFTVIAVEPNKEMREKYRELLAGYTNVSFVDGTAETTKLAKGSIDVIVAAQAFHWFDRHKTKAEFKRILKPGGTVALIWNERLVLSAFETEYEKLITLYSTDYTRVDYRNITDEEIEDFFTPGEVKLTIFENYQQFHFEGLKGRLQSSSYIPVPGDENYTGMMEALQQLFNRYEQNGVIRINYSTKVYTGKM